MPVTVVTSISITPNNRSIRSTITALENLLAAGVPETALLNLPTVVIVTVDGADFARSIQTVEP